MKGAWRRHGPGCGKRAGGLRHHHGGVTGHSQKKRKHTTNSHDGPSLAEASLLRRKTEVDLQQPRVATPKFRSL